MKIEVVSKAQVASRLLREAILLFFEERDPIAIHTVVASAHQVLLDVGKRSGVQSAIKKFASLQSSEMKDFMRAVNYPYNFFKHADQDPDESINIGPLLDLTAEFIMDGVVMLQGIAGVLPIEAKVYWAWFVSKHHELFDDLPRDGEIARLQSLAVGTWPFDRIRAFLTFAEIATEVGA